MPVNVREKRLSVALILFGLILGHATGTLTGVSVASFPSDEAPDENGGAVVPDQKVPVTLGAELPSDPKEAYQLKQRKSVQALRRLDQSLLTPKVLADFQKHYREYRILLTQGTNGRNPKEMEVLKAGLAYRVLSATDRTVQDDPLDLENALKSIRRDMARAGSAMNNNQQRAQFRDLFFKELMPLLKQLLKNNLIARSIAIEVLPDMEVESGGVQGRLEMYGEVDDLLVAILNDPEQPDAMKARAANSITNYLEKLDAIPQIQMAFAKTIAGQLDLPHTEVAYQEFLLFALEAVSTPREIVAPNEAICFCIAAKLMQDTSRDIQIRCHATCIFGRAGYDNKTDFAVLSWATAQLAMQTAALFNSGNKEDQKWVHSASYLFKAFRHWVPAEASGRPPAGPKGFLNRDQRSASIRDASEKAMPVIVHMLISKANVPRKDLIDLFQWANGNKPANLKFDPSCPPLRPAAGNAGAEAAPEGPPSGN